MLPYRKILAALNILSFLTSLYMCVDNNKMNDKKFSYLNLSSILIKEGESELRQFILSSLPTTEEDVEEFAKLTKKIDRFDKFQRLWIRRIITHSSFQQKKLNAQKADPTTNDVFNSKSCLSKPIRCPHPQIHFYLYTRRTQKSPELLDVLDPESFYYTHFNRAHPTKIVIHGFGGGRNLSPSPDMREAFFKRGDYNIIIVDYSSAVKEPCLRQMEWSPRFGGLYISQLVKYMNRHPRGVRPDDSHFIGYSVGAHIAGLVANFLTPEEGKIGRITGLDPTILFYAGSNNTRDLDKTDAHFVDIIHTGAGILGQWSPSGRADFYVNGGTSQPGCSSSSIFQTLACDHTKVTPYFIESINSPKGFYAGPCTTLLSYLIGWCEPKESEYVLMGEHCNHNARGVYYVTTNAKPPYARGFPSKSKRSSETSSTTEYDSVKKK